MTGLPSLPEEQVKFLVNPQRLVEEGQFVSTYKYALLLALADCWLIGDLERGAWVRYVRRFNPTSLGTTTDLQEFLFGSERTPLKDLVPILIELQKDTCFYCGGRMKGELVHVDHCIPWSRCPVDLGHNFVLAHARPCNAKKSDRIASIEHLNSRVQRRTELGNTLAPEFDRHQIIHDLPTSFKVARWAYFQIESSGGLTWRKGEELVTLEPGWEGLFHNQ